MLADAGHDDGVARRQVAQLLEHELRLEREARLALLVLERVGLLPPRDGRTPRGAVDVACTGDLQHLVDGLDRLAGVGDDRHLGLADLAVFGRIDVDVHDLGVRGERVDLAGDPVVEPRAERQEEVRLLDGGDRGVVAVHAGHAEAQLVIVGEHATGHERGDDRDLGHVHELRQSLGGAGLQQAAAGIDDRALRLLDQLDSRGDGVTVEFVVRAVARQIEALAPGRLDGLVPLHLGVGDVLGQVEQDRPGTAGAGDVEGLLHQPRDVGGVGDELVVLGDRSGDADRVALLERIGADRAERDLTGDRHHRHGVDVGVAQRGDDVGRRRAAGHHDHAGLAGDVGVARGHVAGTLLVTDEHVTDRGVEERVVHREDGPAR